jgi:hypothetical protein
MRSVSKKWHCGHDGVQISDVGVIRKDTGVKMGGDGPAVDQLESLLYLKNV